MERRGNIFSIPTIFTDGGGDHNIKYLYVQCVLLALFKIGNFDILNVGQCAPNQSWINQVERCISLLNIGLQGLTLQHDMLVFLRVQFLLVRQ